MIIEYKDIDSDIHELALEEELVFDDDAAEPSGLKVSRGRVTVTAFSGQLIKMDGGWYARGVITARLDGKCDRCGEDASVPFTAELSVNVIPGEPQYEGHEHEMMDDEGDSFHSAPDHLDLDALIREEALLQLPLRCLCSESCKGSELIDKTEAPQADVLTPLAQLSVLKKTPKENK